jgi:purine nucleoside phosphorylase
MNKRQYERTLERAAKKLRGRLGLSRTDSIDTAVVLGTGWGDSFPFNAHRVVKMSDVVAFRGLEEMPGHKRQFEIGTVDLSGALHRIVALRGRIHMNEDTFDPRVRILVRLQIDVLIKLGVRKFILTAAVGSLKSDLLARNIVVVDSFPGFGQDIMPNFPGEFTNIKGALNGAMIEKLKDSFRQGSYVFFRGSHFEDKTRDKYQMAAMGGTVVGMSVKPECFTIAAARQRLGFDISAVVLCYVTNDMVEEMDDAMHRARAEEDKDALSQAIIKTLTLWTD